ncbi:hypothetical protein ACFFU2_10765 [Halomonas alkalicola]|uniref:DUF4351 domain-containing protein n=1 Tax=Halomonas alkalicola TaxID=1930622 RepID=A0ABY9H254_9GAMM|nr:hypothetical protein [Halomonas alkalicola]WLI72474.1 hypothetical protein B6N23_11895 [Halomonas alkalicola]
MARFEEEVQMPYVTSFERIAAKRGFQRGFQLGRVIGRAEMLLKLLTVKFGELPPDIVSKVSHSGLEEQELWVEHILTADSLDEIFD